MGQNSVLWKRDGKNLPGKQINSNELIFPNIKIEDEGNYSCALEDQRDHPSPPVKLKVMCEYNSKQLKLKLFLAKIAKLATNGCFDS